MNYLIGHLLGDFVFQDDWQAQNKKKSSWACALPHLQQEIAQDLKDGKTSQEIREKPYTYKFRAFYYTTEDCMPKNDAHWSYMEIKNLGEHIEKTEHLSGGTIKSRIVS